MAGFLIPIKLAPAQREIYQEKETTMAVIMKKYISITLQDVKT